MTTHSDTYVSYPGIDYSLRQANFDRTNGIHYGVISQNAVLQAWADSSEPDYGEPPEDDDDYLDDCSEPVGFSYDSDGYKAYAHQDGDIFITKSPYYTYTQYCSPCAPGACYLESPLDPDGEAVNNGHPKCYCFREDWFDYGEENGDVVWGTKCPYPIFRVDNDECVYDPRHVDTDQEIEDERDYQEEIMGK